MMGFGWSQKNLSPIGIDFGSDSIKILQIHDEPQPALAAAASADVPDEVRRAPDAMRGFLTSTLRDLLREGGFKGKRVVASISAAQAYTQHVRLSKVDGVGLQQQLEAELRGQMPIDPSMMVIRHVNVGDVMIDGSARQEVICFAVSREYVMRIVGEVKQAGYNVVGMHCEPLAILRSFAHLFRRKSDAARTTFFLDIGSATTKALIAHCNDLVFAKTIRVGGDHFIRQLGERLGIAHKDARQMWMHGTDPLESCRHEPGASATTDQAMPMIEDLAANRCDSLDDASPATDPARSAAIERIAVGEPVGVGSAAAAAVRGAPARSAETRATLHNNEVLDTLIDELRLCLGYHASMFPDRAVDKVVFLGGEARHTHLCQRLAQALRLPAQLGDPIARLARPSSAKTINVDMEHAQPGWAVPLGVCLLPTTL